MKKNQKAMRDFEKLKSQLPQTKEIVRHTKNSNLWNHEASIRKKIRALGQWQDKNIKGYKALYEGWLSLLDEISIRLLAYYNKKNNTDYQFEAIVQKDRAGYINSGIIAVLISSHIPDLVAEEFKKYFPINPKDEYPFARAMKRKIYLHLGDTNTGKTYNAIQRLKQAGEGVYLAPLRILALEIFEKLNQEGIGCNLVTGEEELLVEGARHVSSTVEKLDMDQSYDVAVIDEIQMIANSQRGQAWTRALLGLRCPEIHVCGALNTKELLIKIIEDCGDAYEIKEYTRSTPLEIYEPSYEYSDAEKGDALVIFSKQRVLEISKYFLDKGTKTSVIYGDLPPEVRKIQYNRFISGESSILITTDAIGMGVNLPIRRIIFMNVQKFDGEEIRYLTSQEVKQIGGRAGRQGIYDIGYVGVSGLNQRFIKENLEKEDEPLTTAVIGPSEAILKIGSLPLSQKLALWSTRHETLDYYRKMDIRDYLLILDAVKKYMLPEVVQYKLMRLPFDINNSELLECFLGYVEEHFINHCAQTSKPKYIDQTLGDLELYYQKLNLYYSFSKNFKLDFDEKWVYREREILSEKINKLLLKL
ncbi:helicase-related protein [Oscillospiraceae bacterium PP1C4]